VGEITDFNVGVDQFTSFIGVPFIAEGKYGNQVFVDGWRTLTSPGACSGVPGGSEHVNGLCHLL